MSEAIVIVVLKNSFDIIREPAIREEIYRILKPDGILFSASAVLNGYQKGINPEIDEARKSAKEKVDKVYLDDDRRFTTLAVPGIQASEEMTLLQKTA